MKNKPPLPQLGQYCTWNYTEIGVGVGKVVSKEEFKTKGTRDNKMLATSPYWQVFVEVLWSNIPHTSQYECYGDHWYETLTLIPEKDVPMFLLANQ